MLKSYKHNVCISVVPADHKLLSDALLALGSAHGGLCDIFLQSTIVWQSYKKKEPLNVSALFD